jgi:very-short-patch-repair endonuclease
MSRNKRSSLNKIEQKVFDILKALNVNFVPHVEIDKYNVDFVVNDEYIIECYGDFWHCNPSKYAPGYFNKGKRKTAQDIWDRDAERQLKFESLGYKFLHLWEDDINNDIKKVRAKLKRYLR